MRKIQLKIPEATELISERLASFFERSILISPSVYQKRYVYTCVCVCVCVCVCLYECVVFGNLRMKKLKTYIYIIKFINLIGGNYQWEEYV